MKGILQTAVVSCALAPIAACGVSSAAGGSGLPGAETPTVELAGALAAAFDAQPEGYEPRTHHLHPDGSPRFTNRLILESSPYLLQHAHNPVNWYPWGDEAFETARRLGRPVLLSIGYSTCHWCHVMERESFEDLEIAGFLNQHFVAIKVDREERPDVDAVYMSAVQMITGRGGWPMTVWLTPDRKPFFGGTYFVARDGDRGSATGFLTLLDRVRMAYAGSSEDIEAASDRLTAAVRKHLEELPRPTDVAPPPDVIDHTVALFHENFDAVWGGTRRAPKFPSTVPVRLLMRHYHRTGNARSLAVATRTLEGMAAGGIHDQIGGGFHRYSTDAQWLVPHFEKMLYDNALLALAYLEAFQLTGRPDFESVTRSILDYVAREMTSPDGGFFSATDADSPAPNGHDEEGLFFTWTPEELEQVLGDGAAGVVGRYFGVVAGGNFEGRSILHRPEPVDATAQALGLTEAQVLAAVSDAQPRLYAVRSKREPPLLDDKVITAWNGLMISAFANAARAFDDRSYLEAAGRAGDQAWKNFDADSGLRRVRRGARAYNPGVLEDYAFLIAAFLDLYEAASDPLWLERALILQAALDAGFSVPGGGYFRTAASGEALLARELPSSDGARPSGNSVAALNLLRLAEFRGGDDALRARADQLFGALAGRLSDSPAGLTELQVALDFRHARIQEVVLVTPPGGSAAVFLDTLRPRFAPHQVLIVAGEPGLEKHTEIVPLLEGKTALDGKTTAYVCELGVCQLPTTDPATFAEQLLSRPHPTPTDPS